MGICLFLVETLAGIEACGECETDVSVGIDVDVCGGSLWRDEVVGRGGNR